LDRPADEVVAERNFALQLAGVGQLDRTADGLVRLDLADVVQKRPGDGDVAVDAGKRRRDRADALRDRQRVLEQSMAVGLVILLGSRSVAPALPDRRAL